jgi:hypothetical protein
MWQFWGHENEWGRTWKNLKSAYTILPTRHVMVKDVSTWMRCANLNFNLEKHEMKSHTQHKYFRWWKLRNLSPLWRELFVRECSKSAEAFRVKVGPVEISHRFDVGQFAKGLKRWDFHCWSTPEWPVTNSDFFSSKGSAEESADSRSGARFAVPIQYRISTELLEWIIAYFKTRWL